MASAIKQSAPKAIFFIHNPKAGGTSLRNLLISNYEPRAVSPTFFNAPMDYRLNKDKLSQFRGYQFYAGHYGFQTYLALREGHQLITNFRSPISRIVSLYNYWRNEVPPSTLEVVHKDDAQCVFEAKEKSFSDFIRSPNKNLKLYIENAHFRQLYRSNWESDVGKFGAMQLVKWRIAHLYWFFIVELPELSMIFFRARFPNLHQKRLDLSNVSTRSVTTLTEEDINHIAQANKLDLEIYGYAVQQLTRLVSENRST